jgi:hypothetical protein
MWRSLSPPGPCFDEDIYWNPLLLSLTPIVSNFQMSDDVSPRNPILGHRADDAVEFLIGGNGWV